MKKTCFHCGLDIPDQLNLPINHHGQTHLACCIGCQMVAQSIIDAGLDNYYTQRTEEGIKAELPPEELLAQIKLYDLEEIQQSFVSIKEGDIKEALLMLEGITCAACVWLIEQRLLRLSGVIAVDINFSTQRARVTWDESIITLSRILEEVLKTGYQAYPYDASKFEESTQKERKRALIRLWVAGLSMMQVMMYAIPIYIAPDGEIENQFLWLLNWTSLVLTLPVILFCATPFYKGALRDLKNKRVGMDTPVAIAVIAAFIGSCYALFFHIEEGVFFDSISMFVFLLLGGRYLETLARRKAGDATERLVKLIPAFCHRLTDYPLQTITEDLVARLKPNDIILIKSGETICVDGIVLSGNSKVNEAMLTGESLPINKQKDNLVVAGTLNIDSPLIVKAQKVGQNTRLNAIVTLLDKALSQKPKLAVLADRFASWFVAILLSIAIVTFVGWYIIAGGQRALWVTISLLVISCPCALSLATPTALAAATSALAKRGLLTSKAHALETLGKVSDVVFDKTGTLTEGKMLINKIWVSENQTEKDVLSIAYLLENQSNHPIAQAFKTDERLNASINIENIIGQGLQAHIAGERWGIGRYPFVLSLSNKPSTELDNWLTETQSQAENFSNTIVFLGNTQGIQAAFYLADTIKPQAQECIRSLKNMGLRVHLLSGDAQSAVEKTAQNLKIDFIRYGATPEDKLNYIESLQEKQHVVLMVGDGINDVPVLAKADVSIAIGSGADIARDGGDMVLLKNDLTILPEAWKTSKKTKIIIRENLVWASLYNGIAIPLAILGYATPAIAALGMAISSLLVVSNALRLLK